MTKILGYIGLALSIGTAYEAIVMLLALGQAVTGAQIENAVQPAISELQMVFPKTSIPNALIVDVSNAAADAINKYVLHLATPPAA